MEWIVLGSFLLVAVAGAWVWGKVSDPKRGVVGCCGCGQCLSAGECVLRKNAQRSMKK